MMATTNPTTIQPIQPTLPGQPTGVVGPTTGTVNPNATVQGQLDNILSTNSPLMQRAATRAAQEANKRGLLNSAMGVQAGQEAVLTAALPIAQQDADTYNKQALTNQDWTNKFGVDSNAYQYNSALSNQDYQQQYSLNDLNANNDLAKIAATGEQTRLNEDQKYQQSMGFGDYAGAGTIAAGIAGEKELLETKSTLDLKAQTQAESFQAGQVDKQLSAEEKKYMAEIASREGISEAELNNRLTMQASEITAQEKQYLAEIASREGISEAELANRLALSAADITSREKIAGNEITAQVAMAEAKNALEKELTMERIASQEGISAAELSNRLEVQANEIAAKEKEWTAQLSTQLEISEAEISSRVALKQAEIASNELMQGRQIDAEAALQEAKAQVQKELQTQAESAAAALTEMKSDLDLRAQTQAEEFKSGLLESEYDMKSDLSAQESDQRIAENMADLEKRFENTKALLPLESQAKIDQLMVQIQGNQNVQQYASTSQILTQFQKTVGDINSNKDLDDNSRKKRIEEAVSQLNANLAALNALATADQIDLPDSIWTDDIREETVALATQK
jgi:hypothetical protein